MQLLESVVESPDTPVSRLKMQAESERRRLVEEVERDGA